MNREVALVVFSGGQDSTTCLFWAKRNFKKVYALSFLYGQKHQKEVELAREIARKVPYIQSQCQCAVHYLYTHTQGKLGWSGSEDGY